MDKVARLGYSYLKIAAEVKDGKGPAFEAYRKLAEEETKKKVAESRAVHT